MKRTRKKTLKTLAKMYTCDPRTVARWKTQGAPLHDPQAMATWLAGRKHTPPRLSSVSAAPMPAPNSSHLRRGAAAALERLAEAEARAFARCEALEDSGDSLARKNARDAWLKISEQLRRHDLALEES